MKVGHTSKALALAAGLALSLAAHAGAAPAKAPPELTPAAPDALTRALARGGLDEAEYALERARSLVALAAVRREFGDVRKPDRRAGTLIFRDLLARLRFLSPSDRQEARAILSRPTDSSLPNEHRYESDAILAVTCDATRPLCFHWDERAANRDSPAGADGNPATVPAWVTTTMTVLANVWDTEIGSFGYRAPLADDDSANDEGDGNLDIYLADLGGDSSPLFGYCTSDDPDAFAEWAISAYCVLDDDYSQAQFGAGQTPQEFLEVTAAHEFFHASQFAYDFFEDLALMEGTAMWMEGEVYPAVQDRINYLNRSALSNPGTPVDSGGGGFEYGAWLYWRFLSEKVFADRTPIREIWERADGAAGGLDEYSFEAAKNVLTAHGENFRQAFARFGWTNRLRDYSEGSLYPVAPSAAIYTFGLTRTTGWKSAKMRHLTTRFFRFRPGPNAPQTAMLHLSFDLPSLSYGAAATVILYRKDGTTTVRPVNLGPSGGGGHNVSFGRSTVKRVDLVLTSGSVRFNCPPKDFPFTIYSCGGSSKDENRSYVWRATMKG
ncbi:MAG: MXAN_6640 family putative metalloprotease [Gaiellaceae bacterium]